MELVDLSSWEDFEERLKALTSTPPQLEDGAPLGYVMSPEDIIVDAAGRPQRIDKAFSWEAPIAAHGLMHMLIRNAWLLAAQQPDKVRTEIRRDQEAIARSVDYERNAEGWGGTISSIEAASATLTHVENLISFYVTRIFKKDHSFNLENWHVAWRKASKRDK